MKNADNKRLNPGASGFMRLGGADSPPQGVQVNVKMGMLLK